MRGVGGGLNARRVARRTLPRSRSVANVHARVVHARHRGPPDLQGPCKRVSRSSLTAHRAATTTPKLRQKSPPNISVLCNMPRLISAIAARWCNGAFSRRSATCAWSTPTTMCSRPQWVDHCDAQVLNFGGASGWLLTWCLRQRQTLTMARSARASTRASRSSTVCPAGHRTPTSCKRPIRPGGASWQLAARWDPPTGTSSSIIDQTQPHLRGGQDAWRARHAARLPRAASQPPAATGTGAAAAVLLGRDYVRRLRRGWRQQRWSVHLSH